ncbi:hypothetical protein ACHQM5_021579 [Ranunculus cassubicifolius]
MPRRRKSSADEEQSSEDEFSAEEDDRRRRNKRSRVEESDGSDDESDEDSGEDDDHGGRRRKRNRIRSSFIDDEAIHDSDGDEDDDDEFEDGFINDENDEVAELEGDLNQRKTERTRVFLPPEEDEDVEVLQRRLEEKYGRGDDYDEEFEEEFEDEIEQQSRLPTVQDPKLWMVKCAMGREREAAVWLMQKAINTKSLQIRSAISLDHLKNYIYVEAEKEAHVKEACKGMGNLIYTGAKMVLVPIKEMTDVVSVKSKESEFLNMDTWARIKVGSYKGDLAKIVDVDSMMQKLTVKVVPRLDLQAIVDKLEGKEVVKKKIVPPHLFNEKEARSLGIRVHSRKERDGSRYDHIDGVNGVKFQDGLLLKKVSMKSISTQNITPTIDELDKFRDPHGNDITAMNVLPRKKGSFMKGDAVIILRGELMNLTGWVEKVEEDVVYIRPKRKDLPRTIPLKEKDLSKYFETGNHVKVVSGVREGVTGMVLKVVGQVVTIISDTTQEHIHVFADHVIESSDVAEIKIPPPKVVPQNTPINNPRGFASNSRVPPIYPRGPAGARDTRGPANAKDTRGPNRNGGGFRRRDSLISAKVKILAGPYKGYRGIVKDVTGKTVRVELESQMKVVMVDRDKIMENVDVPSSNYGAGSQTPMHYARTPLRPFMTPVRDTAPGTPIHDGMRTPMRDAAWNPYASISTPTYAPNSPSYAPMTPPYSPIMTPPYDSRSPPTTVP